MILLYILVINNNDSGFRFNNTVWMEFTYAVRCIDQNMYKLKKTLTLGIHTHYTYYRMRNAVTYYVGTLALYQTVFQYGCLIIMRWKIRKRRNNFNKIKLLAFV